MKLFDIQIVLGVCDLSWKYLCKYYHYVNTKALQMLSGLQFFSWCVPNVGQIRILCVRNMEQLERKSILEDIEQFAM